MVRCILPVCLIQVKVPIVGNYDKVGVIIVLVGSPRSVAAFPVIISLRRGTIPRRGLGFR